MLHKTRGVVLSYIRYRESSIIAKVYTEKFGLQSYIVNGVRNKSTKGSKIALFQPLTILDLVVYHKQASSLHRISEIGCSFPFSNLPFSQSKITVAIFISEVLGKILKEESEDKELFNFLVNSIQTLDLVKHNYESFHLKFLIDLAHYLGFGPTSLEDIVKKEIIGVLTNEEKSFFKSLLNSEGITERTSNLVRRKTLSNLLSFYSTHIENFGDINSTEILRELLS